jgi:putative transposase
MKAVMNEIVAPDRKAPVHLSVLDSGNRSNIVFITVCTKDRKPILDTEEGHCCLLSSWREASSWLVGRYVLMPDHLHLFCSPIGLEHSPLVRWVSAWKALASRVWSRLEDRPLWQRSFWDRQLRSGESYGAKWAYVRNNPVRKNLVSEPDAWPYQGELNVFRWHDA